MPPEKPQVLALYEQMRLFQALPWSGGLMDQPWQFMCELSWASDIILMQERMQAQRAAAAAAAAQKK